MIKNEVNYVSYFVENSGRQIVEYKKIFRKRIWTKGDKTDPEVEHGRAQRKSSEILPWPQY